MAGPAVLTVADTIARSFVARRNARRSTGYPREEVRDMAAHGLGAMAGEIQGRSPTRCTPGVPAGESLRSSPTRCRNGYLRIWECYVPAASRQAFIRPILPVQVEYLINDSATKVVFAEDEERLDKILSCRARCPTLQTIIVLDMEGLSGFSDPMVMSLAEFMALGSNHMAGRKKLWDAVDRKSRRGRSRDPGLYLGHHGPSQRRHALKSRRHAPDASCQRPVSFYRFRRAAGVPATLFTVAERSAATTSRLPWDRWSISPRARKRCRIICGKCSRPHFWPCRGSGREFYSGITIALKDATPFQNWTYRRASSLGYRVTDCRLRERLGPSVSLRLANRAAYWLVFRNIRRMLGLDRCRRRSPARPGSRRT